MPRWTLVMALLLLACGGGKEKTKARPSEGGTGAAQEAQVGLPPQQAPRSPGPRIRGVRVTPQSPTTADEIQVEPEVEGADEIHYVWRINGREKRRVQGPVLPAGLARRGDEVELTLVAVDADGVEVERTLPVIEIANAPPRITRQPEGGPPNGFRFEAEDPDGDDVTWSMEGAPPGYVLSANGVVSMRGGPPPDGEYEVTVRAEDEWGDAAELRFQMSFARPESTPTPEKRVIYRSIDEMSREELEAYAEKLAKKVDSMTDEELEEYVQKKYEEAIRLEEEEEARQER